jgi:hypothetical protein
MLPLALAMTMLVTMFMAMLVIMLSVMGVLVMVSARPLSIPVLTLPRLRAMFMVVGFIQGQGAG